MPYTSPPQTPRATDRGLRLVRAVADHPTGCSLADLSREVGLTPSTALRQLRALEVAGFAERLADGQWGPGAELMRIARQLVAGTSLTQRAGPVLRALAAATGESAYLAEVDGDHAVYVASAPGSHAIRHVGWLGGRVPLTGTAAGRALTGQVDGDGVAVKVDGVEQGVTALSSPVRDRSGAVIAAVSLVGPSYRLTGEALAEARSAVAAHAAQLSG